MQSKATRFRTTAALCAAALLAAGCTAMSDDKGGGDGGTVKLSFANSYTPEHPHTRCGVEAVADDMREQDNGVEIETFPNSQLGDDTARVTSVMDGDIDMDVQGSSALAEVYAPIGVLDMAYAFDGPDQLFRFFDSDAGRELKDTFAEKTGMRVLDVWFFGMRHFSANEPVREPGDLGGLRMRFPDSKVYLENAKALGAKATTVAFEELYLSLQRGVVDGQENPIPTVVEMSMEEVQSHVSLTGHQTGSQLIVVNEDSWQRLSGEQRRALQKSVSGTRAENRECVEREEARILKQWAEKGKPEVVEDVDREAFRGKAEAYFTENLKGGQRELYDAVRAAG
ncbi:tRNA modification GTPase [Streptomyces armeniacus]|uniref:tRNA modification GTPase n=2 Tax=Streptomyces armeniacus TaxID=83291 RepID=A0A345XZT3_9ACTN|nr:tRNA modification GTPase [Streptomyces armeniacus]